MSSHLCSVPRLLQRGAHGPGHGELIRSEWVMSQVTISALKSHLSEHLRRAEAGEVIEVLDRARPIAKVGPIDRGEDGLETIPPTRSFASVRAIRLPPLGTTVNSLEALRQERGSR